MKQIPIKDFGKDHWSLLAYVETRATDYQGRLSTAHLRIKNPALSDSWKPEYGTRLSGYFLENGKVDPSRRLTAHDDLDCLDDLEAAGYIESIGTGLHPAYKMTKKGNQVVSLLRKHKQAGKPYATFTLTESQMLPLMV